MQYDLDTNYPDLDLDVSILGVNAIGHEAGNAWFTSVSDLPWLQDVDGNGDGESDAWANWQVVYRDVIILNAANVPVGRFNLTSQDLQLFEYYSALRRMFVEAATLSPLPGDYNGNGVVEQADLDLVLLNWGDVVINPAELGWKRSLPEGAIDQGELDGVLLNWGNTAAVGLGTAAIPEPGTIALASLAGLLALGRRRVRGTRAAFSWIVSIPAWPRLRRYAAGSSRTSRASSTK